MIIENEKDVTKAVLGAYARTENPRAREILSALIRHLHEFAREVRLTEQEFHTAMAYLVAIGQNSNENHNEAVLMAGSLGLSPLICLLNNGDHGQTETDANTLGPFWRMDSPATPNGGTIMRSPTPGRRCLSMPRSATPTASRSLAPKSISGSRRPRDSMRTRIRTRPT